jgi:hypothetical protein
MWSLSPQLPCRSDALQASSETGVGPPPGKVIQRVKTVWILTCAALLLAGCGGGGGKKVISVNVVTVPAYGEHPAATVSGAHSAVECAKDARVFARDALTLLDHSTSNAAYPADLYYTIIRSDFADFEARSCDAKLLGAALRARLTARQRAALVGYLPQSMAQVLRDGLGGA